MEDVIDKSIDEVIDVDDIIGLEEIRQDLLIRFAIALKEARRKHPDFAEGVFHALGFLSEEHGEVVKEITKQKPGWEKLMDKELIDLMVVAYRMLNGEYENN